jgi:hypothetical protein
MVIVIFDNFTLKKKKSASTSEPRAKMSITINDTSEHAAGCVPRAASLHKSKTEKFGIPKNNATVIDIF